MIEALFKECVRTLIHKPIININKICSDVLIFSNVLFIFTSCVNSTLYKGFLGDHCL